VDSLGAVVGLLRENPAFALEPLLGFTRVADRAEVWPHHKVGLAWELKLGPRGCRHLCDRIVTGSGGHVSVLGVFGRFSVEGVGPLNKRPNKGNWARLGQRSDGKKSREGACRSMCWHHSGCTHGGNGLRSSSTAAFLGVGIGFCCDLLFFVLTSYPGSPLMF